MLYHTKAGSVLIPDGDEATKKAIEFKHTATRVFLCVGFGMMLFLLFLVLSGVYQEDHLPLFFIPGALFVFIMRTLEFTNKRADRRRLQKLEKQGKLVRIPGELTLRIDRAYVRLGKVRPPHLLDYNLPGTMEVLELYAADPNAPELNKKLGAIIDNCPAAPEAAA